MLHFCTKCGNKAVDWCARCRRFLCLMQSCASSFPAIELAGIQRDEVIRLLGIRDVSDDEAQKWLQSFET